MTPVRRHQSQHQHGTDHQPMLAPDWHIANILFPGWATLVIRRLRGVKRGPLLRLQLKELGLVITPCRRLGSVVTWRRCISKLLITKQGISCSLVAERGACVTATPLFSEKMPLLSSPSHICQAPVTHVIFDVDGTLLDTGPLYNKAILKVGTGDWL